MDTGQMLIAGGGLAGATAAKTLRAEGFAGPITLLAAEERIPYLRPPLSKDFLLGKAEEDAVPVVPAEWYGANDVELLTGTPAAGVRPRDHEVELTDGRTIQYSKLLLATGAKPRSIPLPGSELDGVMTFRTFDDSLRLRDQLRDGGSRVVMVGSGWIGMELAAAARTYGNQVTLIGLEDVPLGAAVGPELGNFFKRVHEGQGTRFLLPASAKAIQGNGGHASAVVTDTGEVLPADIVVIAVGVVPGTALAATAGLRLENGILVDPGLRTSAPDIFAAGDVANALHPFTGRHHRSEHWSNALNGGKVAAKSMLGQDAVLDMVPYFYTDQFSVGMEYSGYPSLATGTAPVLRGSLDDEGFLAFWLRGGRNGSSRLVAGLSVNVPRVHKTIKSLIAGKVELDPAQLTDPGVPLQELLPSA
ncbi:NAD(P)/FAD-dependent oxidoreductase [Paenarthrobacter sp. NCHU4564]|uniref:NAD(P)/FAD-dependent oxidoreductase n=1 Tax=Paenarthrobacter sp. NCHU4564 TaxID=3451353 RepID=UPI003F95A258